MTKKEIVEAIKKMDKAKIINMWNEYVEECAYPYEAVHPYNVVYTNNCAFFNSFFIPFDAVLAVIYGNYNENDDYVVIDKSGNAQSFTDWNDVHSPVNIDVLANWLIEKEN